LGGDIVVRRAGWPAGVLPDMVAGGAVRRRAAVADGAGDRAPTGGVLRIYRLGQPWLVLEGVSDHYVAIDFAAEVRRFKP
jgi:fructose-specific phosphotransferase system IIC component